jgi:hypothetical protein
VNQILEKVPDFFTSYVGDAALLKSFDRAFWLRHYRDRNNKNYIPHYEDEQLMCPWGDPASTKSFGSNEIVQ